MPQQRKLDCPICNYSRLTILCDHLIRSHNISGKEGKLYCEEHVFVFYLDNQNNLNNLSQDQILHLNNVGTLFLKHSHYLGKRNYQTQYHPTVHQLKMKTSKFHVLMIIA